MRKLTLLTSVLLASSFQTVNVSAQCMNTINCQTLGYTKTSCTKGGVKCPTGNYWYCPKDTTTPQCSSSYKYTCTGYMQSPSGTACNGKYQKCNCSNNYVWNSTQGRCLAGSGSGSGSGGSSSGGSSSGGSEVVMKRRSIRAVNCRCETRDNGFYYVYFDEECTCDETGADCSRFDQYVGTLYADKSECEAAIPSVNSNMCDGHTRGASSLSCP